MAFESDGDGQEPRKGRRIVIEAFLPMVTHSTVTEEGQRQSVVARESIGVIFNLGGAVLSESSETMVTLNVTLSAVDEVQLAEIANPLPVTRQIEQSYSGVVDPSKVILLLSLDNAGPAGTPAVAYVTRVRMSTP